MGDDGEPGSGTDEGGTVLHDPDHPNNDDGGGGGGGGGDPLAGYRSMLLGLRLPLGPFGSLMRQAAAEGWMGAEFLYAVSNADAFRTMFPGIQALFNQGMSVQSAIGAWRGMAAEYKQAAEDLGLSKLANLTPNKIGIAIRNGLDRDEFALRLKMLDAAKHSDAYRQAFNQILKAKQEAALDKKGWFRFIMGKSDAKMYDIWEGAQLLTELGPEGLNVRDARQLARAAGASGQPVDMTNVLTAVNRIQRGIGSDVLGRSGYRTADLALVALGDSISSPELKAKVDRITQDIQGALQNAAASRKILKAQEATSAGAGGQPVSSAAPSGSMAGAG